MGKRADGCMDTAVSVRNSTPPWWSGEIKPIGVGPGGRASERFNIFKATLNSFPRPRSEPDTQEAREQALQFVAPLQGGLSKARVPG